MNERDSSTKENDPKKKTSCQFVNTFLRAKNFQKNFLILLLLNSHCWYRDISLIARKRKKRRTRVNSFDKLYTTAAPPLSRNTRKAEVPREKLHHHSRTSEPLKLSAYSLHYSPLCSPATANSLLLGRRRSYGKFLYLWTKQVYELKRTADIQANLPKVNLLNSAATVAGARFHRFP